MSLGILKEFIINKNFRWIVFAVTLFLTLLGYIQEPIRFSGEKSSLGGITYKYYYFFMISITLFIYTLTFLGLYYTIPFTNKLPEYWYIPVIIILYTIITDITFSSPIFTIEEDKLNPPPDYMMAKNYRILIYYGILILDIIAFIQVLLYMGVTPQYKSTLLHQFFLNRFGGFRSGNIMNFVFSWLGIFGILIDINVLFNQLNFTACKYGLPEIWNF